MSTSPSTVSTLSCDDACRLDEDEEEEPYTAVDISFDNLRLSQPDESNKDRDCSAELQIRRQQEALEDITVASVSPKATAEKEEETQHSPAPESEPVPCIATMINEVEVVVATVVIESTAADEEDSIAVTVPVADAVNDDETQPQQQEDDDTISVLLLVADVVKEEEEADEDVIDVCDDETVLLSDVPASAATATDAAAIPVVNHIQPILPPVPAPVQFAPFRPYYFPPIALPAPPVVAQRQHYYQQQVIPGPLKKDGTPDFRYKLNRRAFLFRNGKQYNLDGSLDRRCM